MTTVNEDVRFFKNTFFYIKKLNCRLCFVPKAPASSCPSPPWILSCVRSNQRSTICSSSVWSSSTCWPGWTSSLHRSLFVFLSCRGERGQKASTLYFTLYLLCSTRLEVYLLEHYIYLTALILVDIYISTNYTCCLCCFTELHRNRKFLPEMHQLLFSFFFLPILLLLLLSSLIFFLQMISNSIHINFSSIHNFIFIIK